jgi:MFS family permease
VSTEQATRRTGAGATPSAWAPVRANPFRRLWAAQLVSNVGTWMQMVGAQWLVLTLSRSATLVGLVQTASMLPAMFLAVPAGAISDVVDRRRMLLWIQLAMAAAAAGLAALTAVGVVTSAIVLVFTFALACGTAFMNPTWQAIQPELVPRQQIPQAVTLSSLSINIARAVGPALGGLLVAAAGASWAFTLNAVSFMFVAAAVLAWRRSPESSPVGRERLMSALRSGGRYVAHTPAVRRVLVLSLLFVPAATALWAMLPVVAQRSLHLGAGGYGVLLTSMGVGAVAAVFALPTLRRRFSGTAQVAGSFGLYAGALTGVALWHSLAPVLVLLGFAGAAWISVLSTFNATAQLLLPAWVRGRALSYYLAVLMGGQALGGLVWGVVTSSAGLATCLLAAAGLLATATVGSVFLPLPDPGASDPTLSRHWSELESVTDPRSGPVLVIVEYEVRPGEEDAFQRDMRTLSGSRRRTGASRWSLFRDPYRPNLFVESFVLITWAEHQQQHSGRQTLQDRQAEKAARAHLARPPSVRHLLDAAAPLGPIRAGYPRMAAE